MMLRYGLLGLIAVGVTACAVRPEPLTKQALADFASDRLARVTAGQEPLSNRLSLYEAMARALKYNLDARVEAMEKSLRFAEVNSANYDMLPRVVASSGYLGRTNVGGSAADISDRDTYNSALEVSWNVLDFGLSYYRAKQIADKALIQEEMKRKVVNRLIEDVRTAYWRAASYQRLVSRMRTLRVRLERSLADTRSLAASAQTSPTTALSYERELIQIKRELETLEGQLVVAKIQLASLINVDPSSNLQLDIPRKVPVNSIADRVKLNTLYQVALQNRPEMRDIAYQLRINGVEATTAKLELLPSAKAFAGLDYDSTQSLINNNWASWGAKASWNLMKIAQYPATAKVIGKQEDLLDLKSLNVTMAVMTQIQVSRLKLSQLRQQYKTAQALSNVQHRLLDGVKQEVSQDRTAEQTLIREEMNTLLADAKLDTVYADVQNAYANVYGALGVDPFPARLDLSQPVSNVAGALQALWFERGQGRTLGPT